VIGSTESFRDSIQIKTSLEQRVKIEPQVFIKLLNLRENVVSRRDYIPLGDISTLASGTYFLQRIDEKFRRTYGRV
ncbi:hypothetical protein BGZ67_010585, partial [Mortierella alpina]